MKLIVCVRQFNFIMEHYGTASTHPHNCVQTSWHAEHFWFWKFRGRRFLIPSLIPLKCNVPMDTTRSPSVQRVASWCSWGRSQPGGRWFRQLTFIWAGPYTIFRLIEYPTTCCSHTLSAAEWHTRFWCAYTSITMEHHLAARTNAFFTFLLPPACHVPWSTHWVLTGCSLDYSLDYSLTTHLTTHLVLTWCSLGAHWVLIDPTWQPSHDASTELHHSSQQWKTCISLQRGIKK